METSVSFRNEVLDNYLAMGWFRMYDSMFTTDCIELEGQLMLVYWMRYYIPAEKNGRKQKDIINRNKNFSITFKPLFITAELESLFALYKRIKPFVGYYSLSEAFRTNGPVFDTWVAEIRNENKLLIAAGIFDKGSDSIAGIMNFYHPDFERNSPGKMLMLAKIYYCRQNSFSYYYPGYITRETSRFNYKLFHDKNAAQVYEPGPRIWLPYLQWKDKNEQGQQSATH
jgi:arginine-tRNA-protein transferase